MCKPLFSRVEVLCLHRCIQKSVEDITLVVMFDAFYRTWVGRTQMKNWLTQYWCFCYWGMIISVPMWSFSRATHSFRGRIGHCKSSADLCVSKGSSTWMIQILLGLLLVNFYTHIYTHNFPSWQNDLVHSWVLHGFSSQLSLYIHKPLWTTQCVYMMV